MTATDARTGTEAGPDPVRRARDVVLGARERVRGGDLGVLPVVVGLAIIWTIFQILNPAFLSPGNLVNLAMESAAVGVIALGVVFVLMVGQIDLSVGSVSGCAAALMAVLFVREGLPLALAVGAAVLTGVAIGWVYAQLFNRLGVPSFVITLSGLLAFLGLQLFILGPSGTINIPFDSALVQLGQRAFVPATLSYGLVALAVAALLTSRLVRARSRRAAGLPARSTALVLLEAAGLGVLLTGAVAYLNIGRGVGWMFVLFVGLVLAAHYALTRTGWGRHLHAVGGNPEGARRAGIPVKAIYTSAFVVCSSLAAIGGLLAAGRLASAAQSSGGGDVNLNAIAAAVIGGTSLFGGRGSAFAALLGISVIQSISSGLTLLNLDSSVRYMITGAVLLIAVALDAVARRSRRSHGRA